jgi:hypothetical protein
MFFLTHKTHFFLELSTFTRLVSIYIRRLTPVTADSLEAQLFLLLFISLKYEHNSNIHLFTQSLKDISRIIFLNYLYIYSQFKTICLMCNLILPEHFY